MVVVVDRACAAVRLKPATVDDPAECEYKDLLASRFPQCAAGLTTAAVAQVQPDEEESRSKG